MIYIFEGLDNSASIVYDETTLTETYKAKGIAVNQLPEKEDVEGKQAVLKCRKSTEEVWWEYVDIQKTEGGLANKIESLEQSIAGLEQENLNIMLAAAETYETMYTENTNLMLAIAEVYETILGGVE